MFTGIVEETGEVVAVRTGHQSTELTVRTGKVLRTLRKGSSLAVNGACLTVVSKRGNRVGFDVLNETLLRTNFSELKIGSQVNLERPLRADGRLDGHFVQGHVDGTGVVKRFEAVEKDYVLELQVPRELMMYLVGKGSLAVDGISLTVAKTGKDWCRIWIIPHTRAVTNLKFRRRGERVNLEVDLLAKYVERMISRRRR